VSQLGYWHDAHLFMDLALRVHWPAARFPASRLHSEPCWHRWFRQPKCGPSSCMPCLCRLERRSCIPDRRAHRSTRHVAQTGARKHQARGTHVRPRRAPDCRNRLYSFRISFTSDMRSCSLVKWAHLPSRRPGLNSCSIANGASRWYSKSKASTSLMRKQSACGTLHSHKQARPPACQ
jgi:hypothetical protein